MRIILTKEKTFTGCQKPGCRSTRVYRHHRGGERTFVKHFEWMLRDRGLRARYVEFCRIYHSFRPRDTVHVCGDHHEEVHDLIEIHDLDWQVEHDCIKAFSLFTWKEAEALMTSRQKLTDEWLKKATPGLKQRKFTQRP